MSVYLKEEHGIKKLIVNDNPYIMLAGEVHNSNSSSVEQMETVWDKAESLGMNTLLLPVSWEMIEPKEGVFDFSIVEGLVLQARRRGKKIVFLWFGTWKNAQCMYAPEWVKKDINRFKRAEVKKGKNKTMLENFYGIPYTSLSFLSSETKESDTKSFRMLMRFIKEIDEKENTVVMVQVENETGLQGSARENSDEADRLFESAVPADFVAYMKSNTETMNEDVKSSVLSGSSSGSWKEVFGDIAEEIFSAYYISGYVGDIARGGREEYDLPMLANCWLDKGEEAGRFPSGGPVSRVMEVWKYRAPAVDVLAPDIYVHNFCEVCDSYIKMNNPLLIPETATHSYAGPRQTYVIGHYHAMGFAPFGFEEMGEPFSAIDMYLFGADTTDPALGTPQNVDEYSWYSNTLSDMMPLLSDKYGTKDLQAVICERKEDDTMIFDDYGFKIIMDNPRLSRKDGVCLILKEAKDEFYIIANGCIVTYFSNNEGLPNVDIISLEEGKIEEGKWKVTKRLNGDEAASMLYEEPKLLKIKLFAYN
ncbi:MAG: DUF5597 domain-containing protein [Suipraeoptans sp.]